MVDEKVNVKDFIEQYKNEAIRDYLEVYLSEDDIISFCNYYLSLPRVCKEDIKHFKTTSDLSKY